MSTITKPILLDETGKQMVHALNLIAERVDPYYDHEQNTWSITINQASSSMALDAMGGDTTSWKIYRNKIGRYLVEFPDANGMCKAHKLSKENSELLEDGTEVDESLGNIMVRLPRLYFKVTTSGDLVTLTMCEREFGENCEELDEQWVGAYFGSLDSNGRLRSISNINPTRSRQISTFWADAQKNGSDFGLMDYNQHRMLLMLYLCEYLDKDSQACLGCGMTGNGDPWASNWCEAVYNAKTGATAELGDSCGKVMFTESGQLQAGACHVSLFGVEDPYGWYWTMVQGMFFGNSENEAQDGTEAFAYEGNRMPTSDELTTVPTGTYRKITRLTTEGWFATLLAGDKFDIIPASVGSSRWGDYHYANTTGQLLLWGGGANHGLRGGLVFSGSDDAFSRSDSFVAARLAHYDNNKIEIVSEISE